MFGNQAPNNGDNPDLITMTEKNLSKKTKINAIMTPNAKFKPIPCLLLKDDDETANNVNTKVEIGKLHLFCLTNK